MGSESFSKKERLLKNHEYEEVFNKGWRVNKRFFVIYGVRNKQGFARLGISVSRRAGSAVKRNRIKRVIKEVFRQSKDFVKSHDIVVVAKKGADKLSFKEVKNIFISLLLPPSLNH